MEAKQSIIVSSNDNCQRELTLFDISGNFSKNFDVGSGMDPFLEVTFAKRTLSTEVHKKAGKDPQWKAVLKFNFLFESQLTFNAFDEDPDRNEDIGSGVISVGDLKGGKATVKLILKGVAIGQISFKYDVKRLPNRRNFQLENIRLELMESTESSGNVQCTLLAVLDNGDFGMNPTSLQSTVAVWDDYLRLKLNELQKEMTLRVHFNGKMIADERCFLDEFDYAEGTKEHHLVDLDILEPFALLSYSYRSIGLGQPSNSFIKSDVADKITVSGLRVDGGSWLTANICLRVLVGKNFLDAEHPQIGSGSLEFDKSIMLYKESREKKLSLLLFESKLTRNKLVGRCDLLIKDLQNGRQKKQLLVKSGEALWVSFSFEKESVAASSLILSEFELKMPSKSSQVHPYVFVKLGESSSARTESIELGKKSSFQFKRNLTFTFSNEQELEFRVYDEDVSTYELIGTGKIGIQELRDELGSTIPVIQLKSKDGRDVGVLTFEHTLRLSNSYLKMLFGEIGLVEDIQPAVPQQQARKSIPKSDRQGNEPSRAKSLKFKQLVRKT